MSIGLTLLALLAVDTDAGRDLLARALTAAGGGQVVVEGIGGELPFRPRIRRLELTDGDGVWLRATDLALVLRPAALLRGALDIHALTVDELELIRWPETDAGGGARVTLPLAVHLRRLVIARLVPTALSASMPSLAVTGSATAAPAQADVDLLLSVLGYADRYWLTVAKGVQDRRLEVAASGQADGPLAMLVRAAGLPLPAGLADWTLHAQARGPASATDLEAGIATGPLRASLSGVVDLPARRIAALDAGIEVAALRAAVPDTQGAIAWERVRARAEVEGPLSAPRGTVRMTVDGLSWADQPASGRDVRSAARDGPVAAAWFAGDLELDGRVDFARGPWLSAALVAKPTRVPEPLDLVLGPTPRLSLTAERDGPLWTISGGRLATALLALGFSGQIGGSAADPAWAFDLRLDESPVPGIELDGELRLSADARLPTGAVQLRLARLEVAVPRLLPLLAAGLGLEPATAEAWRGVGGRLDAQLDLAGADGVRLVADGADLQLPFGVGLGTLALEGALRDPLGRATGTARLRVTQLAAAGVSGDLELRGAGPLDAWALDASARLRADGWGEGRLAAAGLLDIRARRLQLDRLTLDTRDRRLGLLAPAAVDFGAGVGLTSARLAVWASTDPGHGGGAGGAPAGVLELAGRIAPRLELDAGLADLDLAVAAAWLPWLPAGLDGTLDGAARFTGSARAPTGTLDLDARGVVFGPAGRLGLPPARGRLRITQEHAAARIVAEAWMSERARLALDGRIGGGVWSATAPLDLRGRGQADLALLAPWLGAGGRRAEGQVDLDVAIAGTRSAPRLTGRLGLDNGLWRDARLGLGLDDIDGRLRFDGDRLRIERLTATAGTGTLALEGGLGWQAADRPVDLRLRARGAEPVQLDQLSLRGDADLALRGALAGDLNLTGDMRFERIDIRVPERLPPDIPTLDVVERGERRQPRPVQPAAADRTWTERLRLDVGLEAARAIALRGGNLDAELGGRVRLRGTAAAPAVDGGFELLRGEYQLLGQALRFNRGRIVLDGGHLLDPALDFEARAQSPGGTAILAIEGRARAPRVVLRGEPPMTDDEVLSRLLFGVPPGRLSAFQLTRLGLAAAEFAGLGGEGTRLLERARTGFGLGGVRIGSDRRGDAVAEGGRNLSERVYLGARQGVEGGEPRGVLRLQLAPQIRLESEVGERGAGAGAAFELDY